MKLFSSFILGIGCLANVAYAIPGGKPFLFNGAVVFNYPSWSTQHPRDSVLEGANFYCYATDQGYLTFGWWLQASPDTDHSHCRPDSTNYTYYEFSDKRHDCNEQGCKANVLNYWAANSTLRFEADYVFRDATVGPPELGTLSTFYRDEEQGPSAVGTRRVLSYSQSTASDCCKALKTLRGVKEKYNLTLDFELKDICQPQETVKKPWWYWGQSPVDGGCDSERDFGNELR
ncbi:hypothetical protein BJX61DRAFT_544726 [Aspergillus egyptiacus]|nr:hypothetical protein BJX61DRAFT_544726 [Aspergillus egyptiacus]